MTKTQNTKWALCLFLWLCFQVPLYAGVTIQFWNVGTSDDANMYRQFAEEFLAQTGIKVVVTPIGWGNFQSKYLTAMAAGMPPDVGATNLGGPFEYGKVAGVVDLQAEFPEDIAALKKELYPGLWRSFVFKGRLFGVPDEVTTSFLYYRKDIFDKLSLQPPKTWDELDEVIRVLEANDYQYGYQWTREYAWAIGVFTMPLGVARFTPDGLRVNWDDPRFLEGFKYAVNLWNTHNMPTDRQAKSVELFILDESRKGLLQPMFIDGAWRYTEIKAKAPHLEGQWSIAPHPASNNGKSHAIFGGTALVIFRLSEHKKEAMQWIRFIMSPKMQKKRFLHTMFKRGERCQLYISPNRRMWEEEDIPLDDKTRETIRQVLANINALPPVVGAVQADRVLDLAFEQIRSKASTYLRGIADQLKLSQWDVKKAFAQGKFPQQRQAYLRYINQQCEKILRELAPKGNQLLANGRIEYEKYYAGILDELGEMQKAKDIMDWAKIVAMIVLFTFVMGVLVNKNMRKRWISYLFIAPPLILLIVFLFIPILVSVYISFTKYNPILPVSSADWVGLTNFKELLSQNELWRSLWHSFYYAIILLPIQLAIGIILAVGLDQSLKPDRGFKFVYFSPLMTSVVSVALVWTALYLGARFGWINAFLLGLGLIKDPIPFLESSRTFLNCVIVMSIWHGLAFVILINLAGLQNIPKTLYEAAAIDGAGPITKFFKITLPCLKPQIIFLVVMGTIGAIQVFEQIYMLGGGSQEAGTKFGPNDSGMTMVPFIYRKGFEDFHMGEASAVAYILFMVIFGLTFINWKLLATRE